MSALLASPGCSGDSETLEPEIEAFVRAYMAANQERDLESLMGMVSRRAGVSHISNAHIERGWDEIQRRTDLAFQAQRFPEISLGRLDVTPLGRHHALVIASSTIRVHLNRGPTEFDSAETFVLERVRDNWKILHVHYSD